MARKTADGPVKSTEAPAKATATKSRGKSPKPPGGEPASRSEPSLFPVVGIGASAGGLEAMKELLEHLPADTGMAFVIVTHQHPGHTSLLPELLGKDTRMPVAQAKEGGRIEANHIYLGPPGGHLEIRRGRLHVLETVDGAMRLPIDYFFRSLADHHQERAICIVLSGTGTDGTLGLKAIKGAAGMAMVQEPASAKYAGMPSSAIATGLADYVLPLAAMPRQLLAYVAGPYLQAGADAAATATHGEPLEKILLLLHSRSGHDFSSYKANMVRRRVERRMNLHQIEKPEQYLHYLRQNPRELDVLFKELLINVTNFFRDAEAFETLFKGPLAEHLEALADKRVLRVWVPGCASGEEVYSLAIALREYMDRSGRHIGVQIFGTDLDSDAIEQARKGRYPDGIAGDVSLARLERWFVREEGGYRIAKEVREMAIFATQNLIRDPPFTKLDLVSCRNVLIYLNADQQQRLLPALCYALNPGGLLLLGSSESVGNAGSLFETVDKKWKIFRRRAGSAQMLPVLQRAALARTSTLPAGAAEIKEISVSRLVEQLLLQRFCPPSLVLNDRGDIIHVHGRTGAFLEPSQGQPRMNVLEMAREGLKLPLAAAIRHVSADGGKAVRDNIEVKTEGSAVHLDLSVVRIFEPEALSGLLLASFRPSAVAPELPPSPAAHRSDKGQKGYVAQLERDLKQTMQTLQNTVEELETANEELKSTVEELQSTNEEMQSANEELETSQEELQSLNEELNTVNTELRLKVDELSEATDDMQNLLDSTDIAIVFLDARLAIKRYTEPARALISLIPTDLGRPIADLVHRLKYTTLVEDCRAVLKTLARKVIEVETLNGSWYLMRIIAYRTVDNAIEGLVMTFDNIDLLKRAQLALVEAGSPPAVS